MKERLVLGRLLCSVLATMLITAGCGGGGGAPTWPSSTPLVFTAVLTPDTVIPAPVGPETSGDGSAQIIFDVTRDATGAITEARATYYFRVDGFPGPLVVTGADIHYGPAGFTGGPTFTAQLTRASPFTFLTGSGAYEIANVLVSGGGSLGPLSRTPGDYYFDLHSPLNPNGFARGQLQRIQ